ncbi:MAG TPA: hypothetical protein VL426_00365 [Candidatus Binatia bacterium]|jgi:hypothetical protein|nr:hypothetical protein [Candidatus Binatia bacterium]
MFFYGQEGRHNVIVELGMLELGRALLEQPGAPLNPEYPRWRDYAGAIAEAMRTGGKVHVTIEEKEPGRLGCQRCELPDAPERVRTAITAALDFFATLAEVTYDPAKVEVIDLRG